MKSSILASAAGTRKMLNPRIVHGFKIRFSESIFGLVPAL
jgi:hypothetical protein